MKQIDIELFKKDLKRYEQREFLKEYVFYNSPEAQRLVDKLSSSELEALWAGLLTGDLSDDMRDCLDKWARSNGLNPEDYYN